MVEVGISSGVEEFKGSTQNGIVTLDYDKEWDSSLVINKHIIVCPIDNFPHGSFIEIQSMNNTLENNEFKQKVLPDMPRFFQDPKKKG